MKTFAVIKNSDGTTEEIHAPKPLKAAQRALKRANHQLARSAEDSKNRAKARKRVAQLHLRIADRRRDALVLADRTWVFPGCGATHDRDHNTAGNLLDAMLKAL